MELTDSDKPGLSANSSLSSILSLDQPATANAPPAAAAPPAHASFTPSTTFRLKCKSCSPPTWWKTTGTRAYHQACTHVNAKVVVKVGLVFVVGRGPDGLFTCPVCESTHASAYSFPKHVVDTKCALGRRWPIKLPSTWTVVQDDKGEMTGGGVVEAEGRRRTRVSTADGDPSAAAGPSGSRRAQETSESGGAAASSQNGVSSKGIKRAKLSLSTDDNDALVYPAERQPPTRRSARQSAVSATTQPTSNNSPTSSIAAPPRVQVLDPTLVVGLPLGLPAELGPTAGKEAHALVRRLNDVLAPLRPGGIAAVAGEADESTGFRGQGSDGSAQNDHPSHPVGTGEWWDWLSRPAL